MSSATRIESTEEYLLRPGCSADLPAVAELYLSARAAAYPAMPPSVHAPDAVRAWVRGWDLLGQELWVAEADGLLGYLRLTPSWLDDLYVVPRAQRRGVGRALLALAKARRPDGFGLWVFERNRPARDFYARHGLVEVERTDGRDNEEREPDLHLVWRPPEAPE